MLKVIISDFDGVIRHWDNSATRAVEQSCKLAKGTLSSIVFGSDLLIPAITGETSFEQWQQSAQTKIEDKYGLMIAEQYIKAWQKNSWTIDRALLDHYRRLFPDALVVLATNATSRLTQELVNADLRFSFDLVFNSSVLGSAKPDRGFFHPMLMSLGVKPSEAVFIDDSQANCSAAAQLGLATIHFTSQRQCLNELIQIRGAQHYQEAAFRL